MTPTADKNETTAFVDMSPATLNDALLGMDARARRGDEDSPGRRLSHRDGTAMLTAAGGAWSFVDLSKGANARTFRNAWFSSTRNGITLLLDDGDRGSITLRGITSFT